MKARQSMRTIHALLVMGFLIALTPGLSAQDETAAARERRRSPVVIAVEKVNPSVVNINTQKLVRRRSMFSDFFEYAEPQQGRGSLRNFSLGSGVIVDEKGYVITNDHVIRRADRISVSLLDGREYEARLVGTDEQNDIAVLKIISDERFPAAKLGRAGDVMLGETVIAIGNPFGLGGSVTAGIVSATAREITLRGKQHFGDFIQTSAVINPGNSGGPLLNINGEVIGINVAIHNRGPGIGFAIPVSRVREVVYGVLDPRLVQDAWLGLDIDHTHEGRGALVGEIDTEGPAKTAGLEAGDMIVAVDEEPIDDWIDFQTRILDYPVGRPFLADVIHKGKRKTIRLELVSSPPSKEDQAFYEFVGFEFRDISRDMLRRLGDVRGIVVTKIPEGSKAAAIGLREGDVVYSLANISVTDSDRAKAIIRRFQSRPRVPIHIYREADGARYGGELPFNR